MLIDLSSRAPRLVLFAAASLLMSSAASAQPWGGYSSAQPGAQPGYAPNGPSDYGAPAPAPTAGPYGQAVYVGGPYDSRLARQQEWRRRQAQRQAEQQEAYPAAPPPALIPVSAPSPVYAPAFAPPAPPVAAVVEAPAEAAVASVPPPPPVAPAPVAVSAPVAPPPVAVLLAAPQSVALAHKVVESASAYLAYMRKASEISAAFTDGAGVAKEVRTGAAYEPKQFEEGAIAYAAIVALQEPAFIDGVRTASGGDPDRAQQIAAGLIANPASAVTFSGADAAAARASAALRRQGDRLMEAGVKVKQSAYDVQHSAWSKGDILNPENRLANAKTLSATRFSPARDETEKLLKLVLSEQGAAVDPGEGASSPVVSRGLALAALAVLGQAGEGSAERVAPILAEEKGGECLHMAKLNLFQCLAVAGPHYEDIFCLGQHAMMDTAQCVIKASGVSRPTMTASAAVTEAAPVQTAAVTAAPQDYWVPLSGSSGRGSVEAARN